METKKDAAKANDGQEYAGKDALRQFLASKDAEDVKEMFRVCYQSYRARKGEAKETVRFTVVSEHIYKEAPDGDFICNMESEHGKWNIYYGKEEIDGMGVSDSALYRVCESLLSKYYGIRIEGTYDSYSGHAEIESVAVADRPRA